MRNTRRLLYLGRRFNRRTRGIIAIIVLLIGAVFTTILRTPVLDDFAEYMTLSDQGRYILNSMDVTTYSLDPVIINDNVPLFPVNDLNPESYEYYSDLDFLGRCGPAEAMLGVDLMPDSDRENIGSVKPSGWNNEEYPDAAQACEWDQTYWANRCHLLAFALTGENANKQNLITGSREMNLKMLDYEIMLIDYVRSTNNHVMYRVTPVFVGAEAVARGVLMEAYSVEDAGEGIEFCVWIPNTQRCLEIDYRTGQTAEGEY